MAQVPYYHATLCLHGTLFVTKDEQRGGIKVAVSQGDTLVPIIAKKKLAALLADKPPEGEQADHLVASHRQGGAARNGTQLALYKGTGELSREPGLHALGELVKVDKENALLQLQIHPNEKQGNLHKPFKLPLVASLELLEGLPELGSGLEVWGELKPRTGRLVVTRAQAVTLPPRREIVASACAAGPLTMLLTGRLTPRRSSWKPRGIGLIVALCPPGMLLQSTPPGGTWGYRVSHTICLTGDNPPWSEHE
jgi:hypothetical protein